MKTWHEQIPFDFSNPITDQTFTEHALFFDIETTGFSSVHTSVYLIGCALRKENMLEVHQFFAEHPDEEKEVILSFFSLLDHCGTILTFNGSGFDIPYLKAKCTQLGIANPFEHFTSIDIFKIATKLKPLLKLSSYKQKSLETFLGINRKDTFTGGELIDIYKAYVKNPKETSLLLLKQHNYEDVIHMPLLLPLLSYQNLLNGRFLIQSVTGTPYIPMDGGTEGKELFLTLKNNFPVPSCVSCGNVEFYLSIQRNETQLRIRLYERELKFFFADYKNYYYLPHEDTAIHKSIASYVSREHRKKATAATCYTKKYSIFLPQYEEISTPAFRENYKDKKCYFELTEELIASKDLLKQYVMHILTLLSSGKL